MQRKAAKRAAAEALEGSSPLEAETKKLKRAAKRAAAEASELAAVDASTCLNSADSVENKGKGKGKRSKEFEVF